MRHQFSWVDAGPRHDPRQLRSGVCARCGKAVLLKPGESVDLDGCEIPPTTGHHGYEPTGCICGNCHAMAMGWV